MAMLEDLMVDGVLVELVVLVVLELLVEMELLLEEMVVVEHPDMLMMDRWRF